MVKTWVICIDGTWNTPGQTDTDPIDHDEAVTKTNVQILWEVITKCELISQSPYGSIQPLANQIGAALYLNGVGSSGSEKWRNYEGSTGTGTSERIIDAYQFLAQRWQPGDAIFGFGFSRGAFAVRSLMGFINCVGLPDHCRVMGSTELLSLYECYRKGGSAADLRAGMQSADIHFVGVWDTVGALAFGEHFNNYHQLSPANIQRCSQALALDEQRKQFLPEYFKASNTGQQVNQVWFAGAHSNVGGGYVDANLSNITLFWLLNSAKQAGLNMDLTCVPGWHTQNPEGEIRSSYQEFWNTMPDLGKWVEKFGWAKVSRTIEPGQKIHASVLQSMQQGYKPAAKTASGIALDNIPVEPWVF